MVVPSLVKVRPTPGGVDRTSYVSASRRAGCGWTLEFLYTAIELQGEGSEIWDHMSGTTLSGVSTSFRIGGSISQSGPSVNASFSESYGGPDLGITHRTDAVTRSWADWTFQIRGCSRSISGGHGASALAQSKYKGRPYLITGTEPGNDLDFVLKAPVEQGGTIVTELSGFVAELKAYFDPGRVHACSFPVSG
ncbi:MAG: hypothetical protein AAF637_27430 [Pseudomonadota bacterium]